MTDFLVSTFGTTLRDHEGNTIPTNSVEAEMIGVYFSAHWCPPCRSFTPVLSRTYLEIQKHNKSFEIIFVSSDHTPGEFEGYHASMPWLALPYDSPLRKVLGMRYHITGIPSLVLMKKDGTIVSQNGRQEISKPNFIFALPDKIEQNKAIDECVDSLLSDESLQMQIKSNGCKTLVKVLSKYVEITLFIVMTCFHPKIMRWYYSPKYTGLV
uniref:protein-disulfide reductase n=1 Tax=Cardiosporidium cionae TaxID=476202 RepID=A0A3Q8UBJ2_9APIC|nr:transposase [Cardiosporidium cionae]